MAIFIHAKEVLDCGGGLFRIEVAERELTSAEREALRTLFPNLIHRAEEILDQEALLTQIASPEVVDAIMEKADPQPVKKLKKLKEERRSTDLDYYPDGD